MKIGVTGTRSGMDKDQYEAVYAYLKQIITQEYGYLQPNEIELHHGDCLGVDIQVARIAKDLGCKIVCHPPIKDELRGFFPSDETREPKSYFARNRNIVDETELLIVVPYQKEHQDHGGTWYTYDYATKKNKTTKLFLPS
jgi:hypothetical protein